MMVANAQVVPPDNEIWYTTSDGKIVVPMANSFFDERNNATFQITSNEYSNGKGVIKLNKICTYISNEIFAKSATLTSVNLPQNVEGMDANSFISCSSLKAVRLNGLVSYYTTTMIFPNLEVVIVPDYYVEWYKEHNAWKLYANKIVSN